MLAGLAIVLVAIVFLVLVVIVIVLLLLRKKCDLAPTRTTTTRKFVDFICRRGPVGFELGLGIDLLTMQNLPCQSGFGLVS